MRDRRRGFGRHARQVGQQPPRVCRLDQCGKLHAGLKKDVLCVHQRVPDGAVDRFAEVAALGVLLVGAPAEQHGPHVG